MKYNNDMMKHITPDMVTSSKTAMTAAVKNELIELRKFKAKDQAETQKADLIAEFRKYEPITGITGSVWADACIESMHKPGYQKLHDTAIKFLESALAQINEAKAMLTETEYNHQVRLATAKELAAYSQQILDDMSGTRLVDL